MLRTGLGCLFGATLVAALTAAGALAGLDTQVIGHVELPPAVLAAMHLFSFEHTLVLLGAVAYIGYRSWKVFGWLLVVLGALTLVEVIGKKWLENPAGTYPVVIAGVELTWSLPSGHAMRAALTCGLMMPFVGQKLRTVLFAVPLVLSALIVLAGFHFVSDVVCGLLLGAGAAFLQADIASGTARSWVRWRNSESP